MTKKPEDQIIIYQAQDGKNQVALYAKDGNIWLTQNQIAELFDTSKQNIGQHIAAILKEGELQENSVVKNYFTTAADGKEYEVAFYSLDMILAIGFRVRSIRGTQFRIWATERLKNYLVKGFAVNEKRVKDYQENLVELQKTIKLIQNSVDLKSLSIHESKGFLSIICNSSNFI